MVGVDLEPLLLGRALWLRAFVDEVTAFPVVAETLLGEGVTPLGLVAPVVLHVDPQLMGAVRKLTTSAIGARALLCEVLAERGLELGGQKVADASGVPAGGQVGFVPVSRGLRLGVLGRLAWSE